jgi:glutaminase
MVTETLDMALGQWVTNFRKYSPEGKLANYIPALTRANPDHLGVCILGPDGRMLKAGEWQVTFTMQSISKVISFVTACMTLGIERVIEKVDVEPTGDAFNSIIRLEAHQPGKPFNPMINAGAITIASILPGSTASEQLDYILQVLESILHKRPVINQEVFESEWETAFRNRSIAYYLRGTGFLGVEVDQALEVYLKHCSIETNTEDLAKIGLVLAHDGYDPYYKRQIIPREVAKLAKALMVTCGMYDASGKFAAYVGVPAKSGVSGGILSAIPARGRSVERPFPNGCGIGIYGPAIDEYGNSRAGVMLLDFIAEEWDLNIF